MSFEPVELQLVQGFVNSNTFGLATSTFVQPVQKMIDLLTGTYTIADDAGNTGFAPTIPILKGGGIWVDSPTLTGRQLVAGQRDNVIETLTLRAGVTENLLQRSQALRDFNRLSDAVNDFWINRMGGPVYIQYRPPGASGPQYALIYTIEIAIEEDGLSSDGPGILTMTIERELAWRGIPPGVAPKVWTMLERGLKPWTSNPLPVGHFRYDKLRIGSTEFLAEHKHLIDNALADNRFFRVDEIGTGNVNYIDIPAEKIYGDAPALFIASVGSTRTPTTMYFSRSTRHDFFPSINTNDVNQRMRNTWNGGDSTLAGGGGLTASKVVDASFGLLSNGSLVTRYVLRGAGLTTGYAETAWATWTRTANHYNRRWMVFARIRIPVGTPSAHTLRVTMKILGATVTTVPRRLDTVTTTLSLLYIGELDGSQLNNRDRDGFGWGISYGTIVTALLTKANDGVASQVDIADLVFMPIDEPTIKADALINNTGIVDTTGYFGFDTAPIAMTNGGFDRAQAIGQPILLVPGVTNRIYYMDNYVGVNYQLGNNTEIFADIIPRWYGIRDM
jgi:hypothetical protein